MKHSSLLSLAGCALACALALAPRAVQADVPAYGTATVDGSFAEWDLVNDFFAPMHNAGNPSHPILSNLYLRYDCAENLLYILVLDLDDGLPVDQNNGDAWVKIYQNGWSNNKLIDGSGAGNTSPRGFAWIPDGSGGVLGYEAFASLPTGYFEHFEAHINISGNTSSSGKYVHGNDIDLNVECQRTSDTVDLPGTFSLAQNHPNPFNPSTTIEVQLSETAVAGLRVYDLSGRTVATLHDGLLAPGVHSFAFDASSLSSGIYFYTLQVDGDSQTRRMVLLK